MLKAFYLFSEKIVSLPNESITFLSSNSDSDGDGDDELRKQQCDLDTEI